MEDQEFINQLAEKLSKLGTVRPLGFHYLHPYGTVPADSIICNGATYSRALYKDFFDYITDQGWVKTEAEWQEIAERDNGFCPFYSSGDGSTNFRTPKFAPYQQIAMCVVAYGVATNVGSVDIQNVMSAVNAVQANLTQIESDIAQIPQPRTYVTKTWSSGTEWYRVWSDGFIEQGGHGTGSACTFSKPFSNKNYTFNVQPSSGYSSNPDWVAAYENRPGRTTTGTRISLCEGGDQGWDWRASGY